MSETAPTQLTIDIFSDVMCPWCLIGYGQLSKALEELDGEVEAQVRWRPFELNPNMPAAGEDLDEHLGQKYRRSDEERAAIRQRIQTIASEAGVSLAYEREGEGEARPAMIWNTRAAHMLLAWALEEAGSEVQTALKLALFKAHFNERRNVSDREVLLDIAASVGLHREAARAALDDETLLARVIAEERQAYDMNITGVPAMVVSGKFLIPGAQAPEVYVNALRRVAEKVAAAG
ncbi:DsbA family oxidoreductase [Altererythrobacter sp. GH1-8]|uniref:DsbA family oxidoreductase n=1 Tax=Altererythrobacter sp. GH1-8 TaxID=3349333 RepID=UPI00374DA73A